MAKKKHWGELDNATEDEEMDEKEEDFDQDGQSDE
jgi:hypothetical protein